MQARLAVANALIQLTQDPDGKHLSALGVLNQWKLDRWRNGPWVLWPEGSAMNHPVSSPWLWWDLYSAFSNPHHKYPSHLSDYLEGITCFEQRFIRFLEEEIATLERDIRVYAPERRPFNTYRMSASEWEKAKEDLAHLQKLQKTAPGVFRTTEDHLLDIFDRLHQYCLEHHNNPITLFEQGRLHYERGEFCASLEYIESILPHVQQWQGVYSASFAGSVLNRAHLYSQAIATLDAAISANPHQKEAYFERALSYFDTSNFEQSLSDYLASNTTPLSTDTPLLADQLAWTGGILEGLAKGGVDALASLGESVWDLTRLSCRALCEFTNDPIDASATAYGSTQRAATAVCNAASDLFDFVCSHELSETLSEALQHARSAIPEFDSLVTEWDQLDAHMRGERTGYLLGRYGCEFLVVVEAAQGAKYVRNLHRANAIANIEAYAESTTRANSIVAAAAQHTIKAESRFAGCKTIRSYNPYTDVLESRGKTQHIFEQAKHKMHLLGPQEEAVELVTGMVLEADRAGLIVAEKPFEVTGMIKGHNVTARGIVIDGQLRYGTVFLSD